MSVISAVALVRAILSYASSSLVKTQKEGTNNLSIQYSAIFILFFLILFRFFVSCNFQETMRKFRKGC